MNVLCCAACGLRPTEPVRRIGEMPECPGRDGGPDTEGRRHGSASVPRGTYVVDPLPFGAPFEPREDENAYAVEAAA